MRKKSLLTIIFTICIFTLSLTEGIKFDVTSAANTIPSPLPSTDSLNEQINSLKNRIASRVAQLKLVEKRGIIATVTDVSNTQITVSDMGNHTRFIDVDELTRFSSPQVKGAFGISDITKGTTIGVLGLYNKESRRILARFVNIIILPKIIRGTLDSKDSKNYTFVVLTTEGKQVIIDVETITKTLSYTRNTGLIRSGFSKIKEGNSLIVVGSLDIKNKDKVLALRIILLPDIAK